MLSWIEIDAYGLDANIAAFKSLVGAGTAVMVVVKANAYGHGLETAAPIAAGRADWFGVNCIDEARALSKLDLGKPVAILGHTPRSQIEHVVRNGYRQVLYRVDVAQALSEWAVKLNTTARAHLKIETGTNRQGIGTTELEGFIGAVQALAGLEIEGVSTHFANIEDTLDPEFARLQLRRFENALMILDRLGIRPPHIHVAATAGTLLYGEMSFTMVRLGIGAYGIWPSRETQIAARERGRRIALAPTLTWKTRIAQVKEVAAGDYVGYGLTFQARHPMQIAVLPVGYYDGYDRKLSNSGRVLIHGQPVPVIGRVAMNMTMADVTGLGAQPDDEVVLLGKQGGAEIRAEELAEKAGTIPYEIVCRINPLIPRIAV